MSCLLIENILRSENSCQYQILRAAARRPVAAFIPTDGRNRKKEVLKDDKDYKKLYEKPLQKVEAQNTLIESLKKQLAEL